MSYEVEIKFRVDGHDDVAQRLAEMGGEPATASDQEDVYLSHPARDFAQTGEALRLRSEGGSNRITYKGPRQGGPTKTREEIEIAFAEGDEARERMRRLWGLLGFRPVAVLHKRRQSFHLLEHQGRALEVVLDAAEDLGTFVEVEAIAADAVDLDAAQAAVLVLARSLGLTEVEPRSYLRMALERRAGTGSLGGGEAAGDRNQAGQT
jgi:adenylate cyclase, class 2